MRKKLLCDKLPSPPDDVLAMRETSDSKIGAVSTRKKWEQLTGKEPCASCHNRINPLGFAQENFDALGRWRTTEKVLNQTTGKYVTHTIDTEVQPALESAKEAAIEGAHGLALALARSEKADRCFTTNLFRYISGRMEEGNDICTVERVFEDNKGKPITELIIGFILAPEFRRKSIETE